MADEETTVPQDETVEVSAEHVTLENSIVGSAECVQLDMEQSGAGMVSTTGGVNMNQAGAGAIVSDGEVKLFQSGTGIMVANETDVTQGFVGILASSETEFSADSRVLITAKDAVILGAVAGAALACLDLVFRLFMPRR